MKSESPLLRIYIKPTNTIITENSKDISAFLSLNCKTLLLEGTEVHQHDFEVDKFAFTERKVNHLYENDIVRGSTRTGKKTAIIQDLDGYMTFCFKYKDEVQGYNDRDFYVEEVLGNIHQNPELMELVLNN